MQIVIAWHMHWTLAVWNLVFSASLFFYPSEAGFYVKNPELDFLAHFTTLTTKLWQPSFDNQALKSHKLVFWKEPDSRTTLDLQ